MLYLLSFADVQRRVVVRESRVILLQRDAGVADAAVETGHGLRFLDVVVRQRGHRAQADLGLVQTVLVLVELEGCRTNHSVRSSMGQDIFQQQHQQSLTTSVHSVRSSMGQDTFQNTPQHPYKL